MLVDGELHTGVFRKHEMSTNWDKYATPKETVEQAVLYGKDPLDYSITVLVVGSVRSIETQVVEHDPIEKNQAHSLVIGEKTERVRLELFNLARGRWIQSFEGL